MLADRFRKNVQLILHHRGMNQAQLASSIGTSKSYVSQIVRGYHEPGLGVIETMALALRVDPLTLLDVPLKVAKQLKEETRAAR